MSEDKIYYCRKPLPVGGESWGANIAVTRHAVEGVLRLLEDDGVDPTKGEFRVYYPVDSALIRTYVTAEWRPNK